MSQEEVANAMGCSQRFVPHCETANRRVDVLELRDFLRVCGLNAGDPIDGWPTS